MARSLLLNMPFVSLERPAIGISILKARLEEEGQQCTVGYGSLFFAEYFGLSQYDFFLTRVSPAMFAGDWLFSQWLYSGRDQATYLATLRHAVGENGSDDFEAILGMRDRIGGFLEACLERFDIARFDIVGFTTTFEQNLASLSLARVIKSRYPDKVVVLGGANCEGVMGLELHRNFHWVDYVCSGESDNSFPRLLQRLDAGSDPEGIPGVIYRRNGTSCLAAPPERVTDMDRLPDPDYTDYFAALNSSALGPHVQPALLIESARGCWWGAKHHCTFCGLNGTTMTFRAKSAMRVYDELERQALRYGIGRFLAVDNIMSNHYFGDLLPMLKRRNPGVTLFYEIKSNLRRDQVELLRDAGVTALQPGVESLSSHVLGLMRKGVTAIQNVQLLRFCREYGIEIAWNLLYGFPGETEGDYADTASTIDAITHLKPPGIAAPVRLDRFSPNYDQAEHFGLIELKPFSMYEFIYPFEKGAVANLAYFFEYKHTDGKNPEKYMTAVHQKIDEWRNRHGGDLIKRYGLAPELVLEDSRATGAVKCFPLSGIEREIYDYCDEIRSGAAIANFAVGRGATLGWVNTFLDRLVNERLMLREGNQYLALAIDCRRQRRALDWQEEAVTV